LQEPPQQDWPCAPQLVPESVIVPPVHPLGVHVVPDGQGPEQMQAAVSKQPP
jgi:hypothetical protein